MATESNHGSSAAVYARVPLLGNEREESIEEQIDSARRYAEEHDLEIVEVYVDVEVGEEDDENALALSVLQKLLRDACSPERGFDTLLVYSGSRLSSSALEAHLIRAELLELGVAVRSVSESGAWSSPADRLLETIIRAVNEQYRERLSRATRQGIAAAQRQRQGC